MGMRACEVVSRRVKVQRQNGKGLAFVHWGIWGGAGSARNARRRLASGARGLCSEACICGGAMTGATELPRDVYGKACFEGVLEVEVGRQTDEGIGRQGG